MRIAMLATAGAIAFAFSIGSVSAADQIATPKQFSTLNGVKAVLMSSGELSDVKGMDHHFQVNSPGQGFIDPNNSAAAPPFNFNTAGTVERFGTDWNNEETNSVPGGSGDGTVAPSYLGLSKACGNGVITMPGFVTC